MNKPLLVGDFYNNYGPGIANLALAEALGSNVHRTYARTVPPKSFFRLPFCFWRVAEVLVRVPFASSVCFCGLSSLNVTGIKWSRFWHKKTIYLAHGYAALEMKINGDYNKKQEDTEKWVIENADQILAVSKMFAKKIKNEIAKDKAVDYIYNIVEIPEANNRAKNRFQVYTTGGAMPRKNNLVVCEAIERLNKKRSKEQQIRLIIAGKDYDSRFDKYDFVSYRGDIGLSESHKCMEKSELYIQNSIFETFGIAIVEAVARGCKILLPKENVGSIEVLEGLSDRNLIYDVDSVDELANKISYLLSDHFNNVTKIKTDLISKGDIAQKLLSFLEVKNV